MTHRTTKAKHSKTGIVYEEDFDGANSKQLKIIRDKSKFLPSPEEIAKSLRTLKITILLDRPTVVFFKNLAEEHSVSYQQMIREVLKRYAAQEKRAA